MCTISFFFFEHPLNDTSLESSSVDDYSTLCKDPDTDPIPMHTITILVSSAGELLFYGLGWKMWFYLG